MPLLTTRDRSLKFFISLINYLSRLFCFFSFSCNISFFFFFYYFLNLFLFFLSTLLFCFVILKLTAAIDVEHCTASKTSLLRYTYIKCIFRMSFFHSANNANDKKNYYYYKYHKMNQIVCGIE